jgi:hypothetical protein
MGIFTLLSIGKCSFFYLTSICGPCHISEEVTLGHVHEQRKMAGLPNRVQEPPLGATQLTLGLGLGLMGWSLLPDAL